MVKTYLKILKDSKIYWIICVLHLLFSSIGYSQGTHLNEDCGNGIDDDSDGLIDLADEDDCSCSDEEIVVPSSLLPNPSFEEYSSCPIQRIELSKAIGWEQASDATTDYYNCSYYEFDPPRPFPDGTGIVGAIMVHWWNEYLGSKNLKAPLKANTSYTLTFHFAVSNVPLFFFNVYPSPDNTPIDISIYGHPNRSALQWKGDGYPPAGWEEMGSVRYITKHGVWKQLTIEFTPSRQMNAIALGMSRSYNRNIPYVFYDNLILNTTSSFKSSITSMGTLCNDNLVLIATANANASYQWYKNNIAIVGQTKKQLNVSLLSLGPGKYIFRQTLGEAANCVSVDVQDHTPFLPSVNNVNYCQGSTAGVLNAVGKNLLWYTTETGGTGSSTAPTPNTLVAGTTSHWVTQTVNDCESARAKIDVTVHEIPPAPTVNDVSYCLGANAVALTAQGVNLLWYTTETGGTGSSTAPTPNTSTTGTTSHWVTQTVNGCESPRAKIDITVHEIPPAPTVNDVSYCMGANAVSLTAQGVKLLWYTTETGGTGSSTAPTPNTSVAGTTSHWVTQTVNDCESPRARIAVTVHEIPPAPTVNDVSYCLGSTANALSAGGENLLWYTTGFGGTGSSTAPTPNTLVAGTTSHWVTQTVNGCESPRAKIAVTVHEILPAPTVNDVSYCLGATAVALTAQGVNLLWYTTESGGTGSSTAPTPNTSTTGTTSHWVTQTVNDCESPRAKIAVTVHEIPPAPTVNDVSYCLGATAVALTTQGVKLLWYTTETGGTGSSTAPTPNTSAARTTSHWVTQTVNGCESPRARIDVTVYEIPPAPTVNDVSYCLGSTANALSAGGENLLWYTTKSGGTGSSTAPTPNTSVAGTTSHWVTQTVNGCESPRAKIAVTVHEILPAPTVNDVSYCLGATAVALTAQGVNLLWYTTKSGGTGSSTAPTPNTSTTGTTSHWVTQTVNGCESPRAKIDITVHEIPPAPTVNDVSYCLGATAVALTTQGVKLLWYTTETGGTGSSTAPIPNTSVAGTTSHWVTQTVNGCESPRAKIDVTVHEIPPVPTVNDVSYCLGSTADVLSAVGENLLWYTTESGGTGNSTAPTPNTSVAGTTSHWVSQTINGCESPRAKIAVTVHEILPAPTVNDVSYCLGATAVALTAQGVNLLWYTTESGGTGSSTAPTPNTSTTGTTSHWVTQTVNDCESPRAKIDITVHEIPPAPTVNDVSYCMGANAVSLTAQGVKLLWYTTETGGTGSSTAPIPNTSVAGTTSHWVTQTVNDCESPRARIAVTVHEIPPAPTVNDVSYCLGSTADVLSAGGENLLWYTTETGGAGSSTAPTPNTSVAGTTSHWVTQTVNGCESPRAKIAVTVHEILPAPTVNDVSYCLGANAVALTAQGVNLLWYTTETGGTGSSTAPTPNTSTTGITSHWVTQTVNGCESSRAKIDITVHEIPPAPTVNDVSYCLGANAVSLTAQGVKLLWYTTETGGTGSSTAPIPNTSVAGTTSHWVTQTVNDCESPRARIAVTVHEIPPAPTVNDVSYCLGSTADVLSAGGENLLWYTTESGGTGSSTAPTPNTLVAGTTSHWVTQTINDCESPRTRIDVTVYEIPPAPTVNDVSYCMGANAVSLTAQGVNLLWYTTEIGGTGSSTAPVPNTSAAGTTSHWVTQTVNDCESPRARIDVIVHEIPPPPTVNDVSYCMGANAVSLTALGVNLLWYTNDVGGAGAPVAPVPETSTVGTTSHWVTQTVNDCESPRVRIDVTVHEIPPAPTVNDVSYCPGATAVALSAVGENLLWYATEIGGTGSSTFPTPNTSTAGVTSHWVTQTINDCESPRARIDVTVYEIPPAPTVNDVSYCLGSTADVLNAVGENLLWYTTEIGGTGSSTVPIPNTSVAGTTSHWVTQTVNDCESPRARIDVIVHEIPSVPTVNDVSYCMGANAVSLTAQGVNLLWYTNDVSGAGAPVAPVPETSTVGTTSHWVTQTVNDCESPRVRIDATVHEIPPAPTVDGVSYCQGSTADALSAGGENLLWYTTNIGGTGSSTAPIPNTSAAGTTSHWVTQTIDGCESPRSRIDVTVHPMPTSPISIGNKAICTGEDKTLSVTVPEGTSVDWYDSAVQGNLLISNNTSFVPENSGTYYAQSKDISSGCINPMRTAIRLFVSPIQTPTLEASKTEIYAGETIILRASPVANNSFIWSTGQTGTEIEVSPTVSTTYEVTLTNKFNCSATTSIHIKLNDWNVDLGEDKYICDDQSVTLQPEEIYTLASYTWNTGETTSQVEVEKSGFYSVSAVIGKVEKTDTISVIYSDLNFEESAFSGCISFIDVAVKGGVPPYSYSLDGVDYKSNPRFLNIRSGTYTLYVKDNVGCVRSTLAEIKSVVIPNYFSPNGDGVNDLWGIEELDDCVDAEILIFDRYGRQLHKMDAIGSWDGTYRNKPVPSDTYWYAIDFKDGVNKVLKGSVTIKRR